MDHSAAQFGNGVGYQGLEFSALTLGLPITAIFFIALMLLIVTVPIEVSAHAARKLVEHDLASPEELANKKRLSDIVSDFLDCWERGTLIPPP
jgi:hypothetical protein